MMDWIEGDWAENMVQLVYSLHIHWFAIQWNWKLGDRCLIIHQFCARVQSGADDKSLSKPGGFYQKYGWVPVVVQHQVVMTCQQGCFHIPVASHRPAGAPLPNQGHFQGGILVHCKHTNVGQAFKTCSQKISRRGHMENRFYSSILDKLQVVYIVCIFSIYCIICIISALSALSQSVHKVKWKE